MKRRMGFGRAENNVFQNTCSEYILITDGNCIVNKEWNELRTTALKQVPTFAGTIASFTNHFMKLYSNTTEFYSFLQVGKSRPVKFITGLLSSVSMAE